MIYPGYAGQNSAAVTFKGLFPGSSSSASEGAVVVFGFPFETIYPEEKRFEVMHRILNFFDDISDNSAPDYALPNEIVLHQNYPNPFNPTTTIRYALADASAIKITVYDVLGQEITTLLDGYREAGNHSVQWNAGSLASGVYVYTLQSTNTILTKKMMLMK
jgi:hypothetical protein